MGDKHTLNICAHRVEYPFYYRHIIPLYPPKGLASGSNIVYLTALSTLFSLMNRNLVFKKLDDKTRIVHFQAEKKDFLHADMPTIG